MKAVLVLALVAACTQCAPARTPQEVPPPREPTAGTPTAPPLLQDPTGIQAAPTPPTNREAGPPPDEAGRKHTAFPKGQGRPCPGVSGCDSGMVCVRYYGVAGPAGPAFQTCEYPCDKGGKCPGGQRCVTIADGPGRVCRPPGEKEE